MVVKYSERDSSPVFHFEMPFAQNHLLEKKKKRKKKNLVAAGTPAAARGFVPLYLHVSCGAARWWVATRQHAEANRWAHIISTKSLFGRRCRRAIRACGRNVVYFTARHNNVRCDG